MDKEFYFNFSDKLTAVYFLSYASPSFPFFIKNGLGGTDQQAGLAAGLFAVSSICIRPFAGWFLDNISRKLAVFCGLFFLLLMTFGYIFAGSIGLVLLLRFLQGFGWGFGSTGIATNASDTIPTKRFGEGMGYYGMTSSLSMAIAPALGIYLAFELGFKPLFIISIVIGLCSILIATRFKFKKLNKTMAARPFDIKRDLFSKGALPAALVMLFACMPYGAAATFVAIYGDSEGIENTGIYFTVMAVFTILCRLFFARISDTKGADGIVFISLLTFAVSLAVLYFTENIFIYCLAAAFMGFGLSVPALNALAVRNAPLDQRGAANSTFLTSFDIGMGLGGYLAGQICGLIGYDKMFLSMLFAVVLSGVFYIKLVRGGIRTANRPK